MDRCIEIREMKWLPCTLFVISFLRVVFEAYGIASDNGFILIADDEQQARFFRDSYCRSTLGSGCKTDLKKYKEEEFYNYCAGLAPITNASKEVIDNYLESTDFFPVLITGGVLKSEFREGYYLFRISKADTDYVMSPQFSKHISELKSYIVENVEEICNVLRRIDTAEDIEYYNKIQEKCLFKLFLGVSEVYRLFYRETVDETFELEFRKAFIVNTLRNIKKISDFADDLDVIDLLTEAVFSRVDSGRLKVASHIDDIESNYLSLFSKGGAVFYDEEFYYFSETGLRNICDSILEVMSWLELKQMFAQSGLIERVKSGFTVKKTVSIDGETIRLRVVKVRRESLVSVNRVEMLEEYIECKEVMVDE